MDLAKELAPAGVLRASITLGNPVLAQGTRDTPSGVTVDLAHEVAGRLGVPLRLTCFPTARDSFAAMVEGAADLCFLAVEPARAGSVAFTAPHALIEGVHEFADLSDGSRVTLHRERGFGIGTGMRDPWPFLTRERIEGDVLTTVLPDHDDDPVEQHPYDWLAGLCAAHGVRATPDDLRAVPYTVVLGQRILVRLAGRAGTGGQAPAAR